MNNNDSSPELTNGVKYIFDEIAAELAGALTNVKVIERGTTKGEAQKLGFYTAGMIRRAGKQCARFGIRAKGYLDDADSN